MESTVNQTKQEAQEPQSGMGDFCADALGERRTDFRLATKRRPAYLGWPKNKT